MPSPRFSDILLDLLPARPARTAADRTARRRSWSAPPPQGAIGGTALPAAAAAPGQGANPAEWAPPAPTANLSGPQHVSAEHTGAEDPTGQPVPRLAPQPALGFAQQRPWAAGTSSHPAVSLDMGDTGGLRFLGASVVGDRHVSDGLPREDAYAAIATRDGLVACVTDGVSSAAGSRVIAAATADIVAVRLASTADAGQPWEARCTQALTDAVRYVGGINPERIARRTEAAVLGTADLDRDARPAATLAAVEASRRADGLHVNWMVLGDTEVLQVGPGLEGVHRLSHSDADLLSDAPDAVSSDGVRGRPRSGSITLDPRSWVLIATDGAIDGPLSEHGRLVADTLLGDPTSTDRLAWYLLRLMLPPVQGAYDDRTAVLIGPGHRTRGDRP